MSVWNIQLNEVVHFGIATHTPSGGAIQDADEIPRFHVYEENNDTAILSDQSFTLRTGLDGTYRGTFTANAGNGFEVGKFYDVVSSGKVDAVQARHIFTIQLQSGVQDAGKAVWNAPISAFTAGGTFGSGVGDSIIPLYYADIKYTFDKNAQPDSRDEYTVSWFRNTVKVASGDVTAGPYIRGINREDGTNRFVSALMSPKLTIGNLYIHSESGINQRITPGEALMIEVSGTIDGSQRTWCKIVSRDSGVL